MKWLHHLLTVVSIATVCTATAQVKAGTIIRPKPVEEKDSIEYYETEIAIKQTSNVDMLIGSWDISTMKRQAKIDAEKLTNVSLKLNPDSTFSGKSGCNSISGKFSIKGMSIKFKDIVSTKMACTNQEQENWFLKLLQQTVSAYTVTDKQLLLRDGSSNIVFEGSRKTE